MTAPAAKRTSYDQAVDAELERWPGVSWHREVRSKHYALVLTVGNLSRFVIYPASPSDSIRGAKNHLANVRQTLREMGAVRTEEVKVANERRRRARPVERTALPAPTAPLAGSSPTRDPWAALSTIKVAPVQCVEPQRKSLWSRIWGLILDLAKPPSTSKQTQHKAE